ncbi:CCA tRNA nucleotidyltransferase [Wansuia hejianensis]|uniref:CCA tRNA nucleotidyltransferase n=1 Tax=Wansuia hejianensis TaxID=2763667 RepID=A0A926F1V4_9FIRM|nr:CCA tRNA nucleotidyltransferase [Wansuia hejianensis]MBC8591512.1 CCA tRNA nucleotidyltransferase [Wansuia hejianensis]
MKYIIPKYVSETIGKLKSHGYEAFIVGGSVRDLILGKEPSDYDITTNAKPEDIVEVFKEHKTILTGIEFGTVVLVKEENSLEITTYRIEDKYIDGRKPKKVLFANKIEEDLSRRDFTINAMAYNKDIGLIDPFGGKEDLENKIIKTVGNPIDRFEEDHLRILRAVRFVTQLGFHMEENTYDACKKISKSIEKISMERIRQELFKILLSDRPSYGIRLIRDLNILEIIIPELMFTIGFNQNNPHHDKDVFNHILCVLDNTPPILEVRLAALFHDIGKPHTMTIDEKGIGHFYGHDRVGADMAGKILKRLKCSNELTKTVTTLIREHMTHHAKLGEKGLKRLIYRVGENRIFYLMDLQKSDRICSSPGVNIDFLYEREEKIKDILNKKEPYEKKQLDIDGNDIINLGYEEGKIIGEILDSLMEKVLDAPGLNKKDKLIELIKKEISAKESQI